MTSAMSKIKEEQNIKKKLIATEIENNQQKKKTTKTWANCRKIITVLEH